MITSLRKYKTTTKLDLAFTRNELTGVYLIKKFD